MECARAVCLVAREMRKSHPALEVVDYEPHHTEPGCFMSMTFRVDAPEDEVLQMKSDWEGPVLWVATQNPYRPNHRRRNWFVAVHFHDEAAMIPIADRDIRYETSRSGGAGGQKVNKVESAVRAIHVPTGIAVRCEDERSQTQNKARARERLILKLTLVNESQQAEAQRQAWSNHNSVERGNPKKTFRGNL